MIVKVGGYAVVKKNLAKSRILLSLSHRTIKSVERIEFSYPVIDGNRRFKFDIYMPNGISKLKIPEKSVIELKTNILSDTISRFSTEAIAYKEIYPHANVYLVYIEGDIPSSVKNLVKQNKNFILVSLEQFLQDIEKKQKLNDEYEQTEIEWHNKRDNIIDDAKYTFRENKCTLFLGAGVSMSAGGVSWDELLCKVVQKLRNPFTKSDFKKIYKSCGMSPIILGRYLASNKVEKEKLVRYLRQYVLYKDINLDNSQLIKAICEAVQNDNISGIITYNYDDLVETALRAKSIKAVSVYSKNRTFIDEFPVYHVHGLVTREEEGIISELVLSEEEYHERYREVYDWSNVVQLHALDRTSCFFIGLSMKDPNLRRLLDFSNKDTDGEIHHYAFLKREKLYSNEEDNEKNRKHIYIIEEQYANLGVKIIWYDDHAEVPELLRKIIAPMKFVG